MPQCVIIADDLTGANATGVLLKKLNLKTSTIMNMQGMEKESLMQYDAITYPTDSRAIPGTEAYRRVFKAVTQLKSPEVRLYNKRIDSTLRGNLGAEIDGMLDGLGEDRVAVVVPCFPQAGRIAVGGYLLVHGVMLQQTDAARDPKNPIHTSVIEELVKGQTRYPVQSIDLNTVYSGIDRLQSALLEAVQAGKRILIMDAIHQEDLDTIAQAVIGSGLPFITVDPGPFTAAVADQLLLPRQSTEKKKILMSIGSVTSLTRTQVAEVERGCQPLTVYIRTERLIDAIEREQEVERVVSEILKREGAYDLCCVVTNSVHPEFRLDLVKLAVTLNTTEEELSHRINGAIAEITYRILRSVPTFQGIFSSGGDITVAICERFRSSGMELLQEIIPLAAYGTLVGGDFPGLKIVTKGGMVGDQDGMKQCIQYLREQL